MNNLVSIGRMAEMNGITVATLRLYDEMNLLKPRRTDPKTGYRYYDITQNARLDMIAYMKELGMSLSEIQNILEKEDMNMHLKEMVGHTPLQVVAGVLLGSLVGFLFPVV